MKFKEEEGKSRQNSNVLIFVFSFLLLASIALSVIGLINGKKKDEIKNGDGPEESQYYPNKDTDNESLNDLFQKEFLEMSVSESEYANDPFRKECAPSGEDGVPAISSFTVCYY